MGCLGHCSCTGAPPPNLPLHAGGGGKSPSMRLAARRTRPRRSGRAATRRLPRQREGRARRAAHTIGHRVRALLRRVRRHATGDPRAVRQPHQPRLGPGAAQALLPPVQLRAAGRRHRGRDRAVALHQPQFSAGGRGSLPAFQQRRARAGAGPARRAAVPRALALERGHRAGAAALHRRQENPAAAAAHEERGPARRGVPGPGRLPGEHRRRAADSRPSAGGADPARLPARGDGRGWPAAPAATARRRRDPAGDARPRRAQPAGRRGAQRRAQRLPRRRAAGGTPHPRGAPGRAGRRRRPGPARSRRHRGRAHGGLARGAQRGRDARGAGGAGRDHHGRGRGERRLERQAARLGG